VRLEPQPIDTEFINWMGEHQIPFVIVFTKSDKISKNKVQHAVGAYKKILLKTWEELPPLIITSAVTKTGRNEITDSINQTLKMTSI
jgi:GTP-binding protein